jgi:chromosome segregation ATPase
MLSPRLPHLVVTSVLVAGTLGCAWAQPAGPDAGGPGIYTCVDAKGRRLTSDRPIVECLDRQQQQLNSSGTVRRIIGPSLTAAERAAQAERERKAAEERQRAEEERRVQRALLARYPNQAAHDADRAKALQGAQDSIESARRRLIELKDERKKLAADTEFYKDASKWPPKLKRQIQDNEQAQAAQERYIADQEQEKKRINAQFDQDLAKLKTLWAQMQASTGPAGAPAR